MENRNSKKQCPTVENIPKQPQQNFTTSTAAPTSPNSMMTANPAPPIPLNVTSATATTTATIRGQGKHKSVSPHAKSHGMAPHSTFKHDDNHIHRASPIHGLPPEEKTPQNTLEGKAQGDIKISGSNQARWVKPTTYGGPVLQERGAEPAIRQGSTKHEDGYHQLLAPTCGLQPGITNKTGIQDEDIRIPPRSWKPVKPTQFPPLSDDDNNREDQDRGTEHQRQQTEAQSVQRTPTTIKTTISNQFSWKRGFLTNQKTPTRRITPQVKPRQTKATAHRPSTTTTARLGTCKTGYDGITCRSSTTKIAGNLPTTVTLHPVQSTDVPATPCTLYTQRYDARLCLYGKHGEVYSEWEALTNFLLKLQALDNTIQLLPWHTSTQDHNTPPIKISSIPKVFFDLQTYAPRLASTTASWTTRAELGRTRHPYIFLSSSVPPDQLVGRMGTWLRETKQGMWARQLPLAEQTICIGWLLYSAPEYDLSELRKQLKLISGVNVALRFRSIHDGTRAKLERTKPRPKAIHMEVEYNIQPQQKKQIEHIYALTAHIFPLGIKM